MYTKEVTVHYTCDRVGCNASGSGKRVPKEWRRVNIAALQMPNEPHVPLQHTLLCPACLKWLQNIIHFAVNDEKAA